MLLRTLLKSTKLVLHSRHRLVLLHLHHSWYVNVKEVKLLVSLHQSQSFLLRLHLHNHHHPFLVSIDPHHHHLNLDPLLQRHHSFHPYLHHAVKDCFDRFTIFHNPFSFILRHHLLIVTLQLKLHNLHQHQHGVISHLNFHLPLNHNLNPSPLHGSFITVAIHFIESTFTES